MKMNDIVKEGTMDDLGLKGHGSELDNDNNYDNNATEPMFARLLKATTLDNEKVKTDDGESFVLGTKKATMIRKIIGPDSSLKPRDREALDNKLKKSANFKKIVDANSPQEIVTVLKSLMRGDETPAEPSVYR